MTDSQMLSAGWAAAFVYASDDLIIGCNAQDQIVAWNATAQATLGWSAAEIVGTPFSALLSTGHGDLSLSGSELHTRQPGARRMMIELRGKRRASVRLRATITCRLGIDGTPAGTSVLVRAEDLPIVGSPLGSGAERFLFEGLAKAPIGIAQLSLDGKWLSVNDALCEVTGYARGQLLATTCQAITHSDDLQADIAQLNRLLSGEIECYTREKRFVRKDTSTVWANVTTALVRDYTRSPNYLLAVIEDISRKYAAEEALHESEERQRRALSAARIGHWEWNLDADIVTYHGGLQALYGRPDASPFQDHQQFLQVVHPDDRESLLAAVDRCFLEGVPYDTEFRVVWPDGSVRWLVGKGDVLRDKSGRAVRMAGVNIDITDRKQAEDERRRREIEFETLAENCPSIISRFDLNHRHLYVNRSIEPITGLSRAAFIGRTNRELGMPPEMCTFWEEKLESVVRTRRELTFEFSFAGPSGTYHFESKVVPEFGPDGQVVSVLCLASDISDRRQLQAQILSIAEREQRRIGQDLHDDVGQELTGLGLMSEALCDALEGRDERLALLATRVRSRLSHVQRRVRLISGLLVPVELDRGGLMVALEELCRRITGSTSDLRASFQCEDQVQVADNRVATQLYRIAQEAMANAIKHGDARYVAVSLRRRGGLVILEIRDDGKGLMADSPKSGMGIEIMRYRAGLINGSLDIGTAEAGGTKVVCILAEEER